MSTHKHIDKICVIVMIAAVILTLCFINGEAFGLTAIVDEDAESYEGNTYFTANDLNGTWSTDNAVKITLNGDSAKVSGNGAYFYDGNLVISGGGYYVCSGELTDGSIVVDAYSSSKVFLMLDGVSINCTDDAGIIVDQADKVFLTLAEGSENVISCGETYSDEALSDNTGGAIFAHDDLTINGSGSLSLTAAYKHGIDANDDLKITGGSISITCPQDGLHVNDSFRFCNASLSIDAGDDGIHSDTDIYIESGELLISECYEGIEAPIIEIAGGDITIYPSDDGLNANGGSGDMFAMGGGMNGGMQRPSEEAEASGDADAAEDIDEAAEDAASTEDEEETYILISGGNLTVINETGSDADGIDSNGDLYITGGTVRISLVNSGTNSALDYASESGGVCEISGGTVIAAGSYSMAEQFDSSSEQCSILYTYSAGAAAGSALSLSDADGNVLLSWEVPCSFSAVNLSCPEMQVGGTYTVSIDDNIEEITLDEISAAFGDAESGGFGGSMNFGGMGQRGGGRGGFGGRSEETGTSEDTNDTAAEGSEETVKAADGEMPDMGDFGGAPPDMEDFDGEMPDMGEFDGEMPERPEDRADGSGSEGTSGTETAENAEDGGSVDTTADFGGAPPDMEDFDGEMPDMSDFDGERPEMPEGEGGPGGMPGDEQQGENADTAETVTANAGTALSEMAPEVWIWLGASAAALCAGLLFAFLYRRRR